MQKFVANQIGIKDIGILAAYAQRSTTKREHTALLRKYYDYNEFVWPWTFRLYRLLFTRSWISNERPSLLFDLATTWLIQNKVLLPGASTLTRSIYEIRQRGIIKLWSRLAKLPSPRQKQMLENLLILQDGESNSMFDQILKGPVNVSGPAFVATIDRYKKLKSMGLLELSLNGIPPVRLKSLARYAAMVSRHKVARMNPN